MARYRVGEGGIRVTTNRGAVYSLPPGAVIDEIPDQYEGKLEVLELDEVPLVDRLDAAALQKRLARYDTKVIRPSEDKSL